MIHKSEQLQIFYILSGIDYSQSWEYIEHCLGYDLGDHVFKNEETYNKVRSAAKHLWVEFNGYLNKSGNPSKEG
jgi:hypothetical protein